MAKRSKPSRPTSPIAAAAQKLFDRFPVAHGADALVCKELLDAVIADQQPLDLNETLLTNDVVAHTWRLQRLRSIEGTLFTPPNAGSQQTSLSPASYAETDENIEALDTPTEVLVQRPATRQERARLVEEFKRDHPEKYQEHLRRRAEAHAEILAFIPPLLLKPKRPATMSAEETNRLDAEAFKQNSREIEVIADLAGTTESRRNEALRELERYQTKRHAQAHPEKIVDAEFTEVPAPKRRRRS